jgi:hypothetical protein
MVEQLRIDGHAEDLVSILRIAVGPDGTIAVDQRADHAVRLYHADGRLKGRFGSRGEGPGEFASLYGIGWLQDTLWIGDSDQPRVTFVSPDHSRADLSRSHSRMPRIRSPLPTASDSHPPTRSSRAPTRKRSSYPYGMPMVTPSCSFGIDSRACQSRMRPPLVRLPLDSQRSDAWTSGSGLWHSRCLSAGGGRTAALSTDVGSANWP